MEIAQFDRASAVALRAHIVTTNVIQGSYTLFVWEAGENTIVMERRGNFVNVDDDVYELPLPNEANDGRLVECIATVLGHANETATVSLMITLGNEVLAGDVAELDGGPPAKTADLFVALEAL
jgi:hypothetical protein